VQSFIGIIPFVLCAGSAFAQEPELKKRPARKEASQKVFWMTVGMPMAVVTAAGVLVATHGLKGEDFL